MVAMELQMSIIMLVMLLRASQTFLICDSSNIPAVLSTSKVFTDQAAIAIDALRQASVPMTLDTAIAIGISEIFAGVAAGAATRGTADFLGDKKKDTFRTKVSTTGAFFGARSLAVGLARAYGLPKPLALLCGSLAGSLVSEGTKIAGRSAQEQNDRLLQNVTAFDEESGMKGSEISGDIVKWLVYGSLEDKVMMAFHSNSFELLVLTTFFVGALSAISGTVVRDIGSSVEHSHPEKNYTKVVNKMENRTGTGEISTVGTINMDETAEVVTDKVEAHNFSFPDISIQKYSTSAIEGGVLFASYQIVSKVITTIVPEPLNIKFAFNQVIESLLKEINPDIV